MGARRVMTMTEETVYPASISMLKEFVCPLSAWNELQSPILEKEVFDAIENGQAELVETPLIYSTNNLTGIDELRQQHIKKIAYFVVNEAMKPIHIEISMHDEIAITDGNHRLAAAFIRNYKLIRAEIFGFTDSPLFEEIVIC